MLTEKQKARCRWHIWVPVCETLAGCRIHLRLFSDLAELQTLCRFFGCSIGVLDQRLFRAAKSKRKTEEKLPLLQ